MLILQFALVALGAVAGWIFAESLGANLLQSITLSAQAATIVGMVCATLNLVMAGRAIKKKGR